MKKLLVFLAVAGVAFSALADEPAWKNPVDEIALSRETPFSLAIGAGTYAVSEKLFALTGLEETYAEWLAMGTTFLAALYKEDDIDQGVNGQAPSMVDMAWTMVGAGLTKFITDNKESSKPHAKLEPITEKSLVGVRLKIPWNP